MTAVLDDTWGDCLGAYQAEVAKMKLWDTVCLPGIDQEQLLSSPELMDPKTDTSFGWQNVGSASGFFASKQLTNVATLTEDQLLEVVDTLFAKEMVYLSGRNLFQSILSFVYFVRMHELQAKNKALYAYARAVLRTLDFVSRSATMTSIRDEEEFSGIPVEIDTQSDCQVTDIIAELDAAMTGMKSEALKSRFVFRKHLLQLFFEVFSAEAKGTVQGVVDVCTQGIATLKAFQRTAEPVEDNGLFRSEMSSWLSIVVPVAPKPTPPFGAAVETFSVLLDQIRQVRSVFAARTLASVTSFLESIGTKKPLLPTRCILLILLFGENPNNSFLHGNSLHQLILETVANLHGAPIYGKVVEGDEGVLRELAVYAGKRLHQGRFAHEATEATKRWVVRVSRCFMQYWEALLCNRGRAHRRLSNLLEEIGVLQLMSVEIDTVIFSAPNHGMGNLPKEAEREMVSRSMVLTSFVLEITYQVMTSVLHLMLELKLLANAEIPALLFYLTHVNAARLENLGTLYLGNHGAPIPERRVSGRTGVPQTNPALTMRFSTTASMALLTRIDASRLMADVTFRAVALLEHEHLLDISAPKTSLVPTAQTFNNRFKAFARLQRPGFFTFEQCAQQKNAFVQSFVTSVEEQQKQDEATTTRSALTTALKGLTGVAKQISDRVKQAVALSTSEGDCSSTYLASLEKAARATFVSLNLLNTLEPAALANFAVTLDTPAGAAEFLAVTLKRK